MKMILITNMKSSGTSMFLKNILYFVLYATLLVICNCDPPKDKKQNEIKSSKLINENEVNRVDSTSREFPWDFSLLNNHLQSPVDVITQMAYKERFGPLRFTAVNDRHIMCTIKNSGHGVTITLDPQYESFKPRLTGAFLKDTYIFENLHYHWGKEDYFGSEHFINGESFSFEGHMVFYKKEYKNIKNSLMFRDGVVVLTFFAKIGEPNRYIDRMLNYIPQIIRNNSVPVRAPSADPILWFLPDVVNRNEYNVYYAYPGSLTTPPFTESVTFILLPQPISISHNQLEVLRQLRDSKTMPTITNRRELQPLRGRPLISANNIQWNIMSNNQKHAYTSSWITEQPTSTTSFNAQKWTNR